MFIFGKQSSLKKNDPSDTSSVTTYSGCVCAPLIGGATAKIGDPSGKKHERPELGESVIARNIRGIAADLKRVAENHAKYFAGGREIGDLVPSVCVVR